MPLEPLKPFGAVARGALLRRAGDREIAELREAAARHCFVLLPEQEGDDRDFAAFPERLGPLTSTRGETPLAHHAGLNRVSNVGRSRRPRSVFHTDTSYVSTPPSLTALRAIEVPERGGETLVTDQYAAWRALPAGLRRRLAGRFVRHRATGIPLGSGDERESVHPLVRRNPDSRLPALYLSTPERCDAVSGLPIELGARLLRTLYRHSTRPERTYRHRWQAGDVLIRDNRCSMHRADHSQVVGRRVLHRGMLGGERPIPA